MDHPLRGPYFKLIAVLLLVFGGTAIAVPGLWNGLLSLESAPAGDAWARSFGAMALGFGVLVWVASSASDPRARQATAGAVAVTFLAGAISDAMLNLNGTYPSDAALLGWGYAVSNLVIGGIAGYFLLYRAPRSAGLASGEGDRPTG